MLASLKPFSRNQCAVVVVMTNSSFIPLTFPSLSISDNSRAPMPWSWNSGWIATQATSPTAKSVVG